MNRVLVAGGGAYHLGNLLRQQLALLPVEICPDADAETFVYIDIEAIQESNGLSARPAIFMSR